MNRAVVVIALVFILALVNYSIVNKEKHLAEGKIVYLELAPVDPRSLMQGDYMALNFGVAAQVDSALSASLDDRGQLHEQNNKDGHVVLALDERDIGTFVRLDNGQPLAASEIKLRYRLRNGGVKFATNAFFFQEGHAQAYETARFGQFRVDEDGELLLAAMFDENLIKISSTSNE